MRYKFVKTGPVKQFLSAMNRLQTAGPEMPKMALLYGKYGVGRTKTAVWYAGQNDDFCKCIRLVKLISGPWLLSKIIGELKQAPVRTVEGRMKQLTDILLDKQYILIFDEIDYAIGEPKVIETLRDIHDITGTIIVFIGMEDAARKLMRYPHLNDRVVERIHFGALTMEDIRLAAKELCEIPLNEDALHMIYSEGARFRPLLRNIYAAEAIAKANSLKEVTAADLKGARR